MSSYVYSENAVASPTSHVAGLEFFVMRPATWDVRRATVGIFMRMLVHPLLVV